MIDLNALQEEVHNWVETCFGSDAIEPIERSRRMVEEIVECAQAIGLRKSEVKNIVDFVYDNKPGDITEEFGDAFFVLLAASYSMGLKSEDCINVALEKIKSQPPEYWMERRRTKARAGISNVPKSKVDISTLEYLNAVLSENHTGEGPYGDI